MVLVAIPLVARRHVLDKECCTLNGTGAFEKLKLVVGDSFEKRGSAGWDGSCSKVIGNSAENFKHGSFFGVTIEPLTVFAGFRIAAVLLCLL
jgi:hypothetical protein